MARIVGSENVLGELEVAPSGVFAFVEVEPLGVETQAVVQILALGKDGDWYKTPGRYYAKTVAPCADGDPEAEVGLWLDFGAKWFIDGIDAVALGLFARQFINQEATT